MRRNPVLLGVLILTMMVPLGGAEFVDQPSTYSSSLSTHTGPPVYDWMLGNMIKMWIGDAGYANMVLVFNECFAGGMMDDLRDKLLPSGGDVALLGAARHNESSYGDKNEATDPEDDYAEEVNDEFEKTGASAPNMRSVADTAEKEDESGPNGLKNEHPQSTFIGNGGNVKIGKNTDGTDAVSKHAIIFAGNANGQRHWNDVDRAYKALVNQHGFSASDVHVLVANGPGGTMPNGQPVPSYVDGKGTKADLFNAIKSIGPQMNSNEQFVFIATDHGNRERTETALNKAIQTPNIQEVPPYAAGTQWDLDQEFLEAANRCDTQPTVSLLVDPPEGMEAELVPNFLSQVNLLLNNVPLTIASIEPIEAFDDDDDIDCWEILYNVMPPAMLTGLELIEVEYLDLGSFLPYTIIGLQIGTGDVDMIQDVEGIFGDGFETAVPDRWSTVLP